MADEGWREAERRWLADPSDKKALARAIELCRREGVAPSPLLIDAQVSPPCPFDSRVPFVVECELPDGKVQAVGKTPAAERVKIPAHRTWWVVASLDAERSFSSDPALQAMPNLRNLTRKPLEVSIDEIVAKKIPGVTVHQHSLVQEDWVDQAVARLVAEAPELRSLGLSCTSLTEEGLARAASLRRLRRLDLGGEHGDLGPLKDLPELVTLQLYSLSVPKSVPRSVCRLGLLYVDNADETLEGLSHLEHLSHLNIHGSDLTDRGLAALRFPRLRELDISMTEITHACIETLVRAAPGLEVLSLERCRGVTDASLAKLATLPLRVLNLDYCDKLTGKGLLQLGKLEHLETLYVRGGKRWQAKLAPERPALDKALPDTKIWPSSKKDKKK